MNRLILIETSTVLCSTAIAEDGRIICEKISDEPRAHASLTAKFVSDMLKENGLKVDDCDAVAVSEGPGSYTGLRVGVSTAKGLCFGAGIPLIAIGTLDTLAWQAVDNGLVPEGCEYIVPMIDARRMEVYTGVFTTDGRQVSPTTATIVTGDSFSEWLDKGPVLFIGDGARKCEGTINHPDAVFAPLAPKASGMVRPATEALKERRFKDVAYFEPFYLKEFVTTVSKKKLF
ncbi:MAG: tRNA (adenosine(37)-N6)-threonylcarbamoyltransferase complex dimerization subunit type 1 TsaB [Bacteroidales bacterium]|nr:tRNA (adenosine(37)-N6)-threonylcarbamoyltransferase complex dimerization subunit type 1 TsaB [Bacteroidales bacterium]